MASQEFAYIWRYEVDPQFRSEFLAAYDPRGEWVQLFSRDPAYLGTALFQDLDDEDVYVTVDYWRSKVDRDSFRERFAGEFDSLDCKCEKFTKKEQFLGDYANLRRYRADTRDGRT